MPRISREKKEEVRKKILSVSKQLFFENGYYNTSTLLIAQEVGVVEGTLFNYFETKADIFLSSISENYFKNTTSDEFLPPLKGDVIDMILEYINDKVNSVLTLPKKVLIELATASVSKAMNKKDIVGELTLIDRKYIKKLTNFIDFLQEEHLVKETSSSTLGECIFSIVMMELFIYVNIKSYTKDDVISGIKEKIKVLMVGHLVNE